MFTNTHKPKRRMAAHLLIGVLVVVFAAGCNSPSTRTRTSYLGGTGPGTGSQYVTGQGYTTRSQPATSTPPAGVAQRPTQQWTCPMHPNVLQDSPGKCPACKMNLVPKE